MGPAGLARVYRQLRKSLEDSKDEPGAADFYYGEMEMRRHDRTRPWGSGDCWTRTGHCPDGEGPRVVDFGIARAVEGSRLTATGIAVGTPGFLAPEQAEGLPVTPAADVFAPGAVLIAASGGSAFGDGTPAAMMYRSVHHEPDLTTVPPTLRGVIAACMGKKPQQRPAAGQLLDLLSLTELGGPPAYEPTQVASASPPPMPAHQPSPPSLPPTSDADAESPQLLAMDRKNAIMADIEGISLGNNGRTIHLAWPSPNSPNFCAAWTCTRAGKSSP